MIYTELCVRARIGAHKSNLESQSKYQKISTGKYIKIVIQWGKADNLKCISPHMSYNIHTFNKCC